MKVLWRLSEFCINKWILNQNFVKIIVEVNDTGIGIEPEKLQNIVYEDGGRGINSVKKLLKLLDGTLEIESKVNEYTKVNISFMQKIVEDNKIREIIKNNKEAEKFSLKGKNVVVVDDNVLNLKVTKRLLESYDLEVVLFENGQESIEYLKENHADLVLMDQMMPSMSGDEVLKHLKELGKSLLNE